MDLNETQQQRLTQLVKEKRDAGLPKDDAERIALRQIATDHAESEQAAAKAVLDLHAIRTQLDTLVTLAQELKSQFEASIPMQISKG